MTRTWLVVVDPQRVFADPGSPWGSPMFAATLEPVRALAARLPTIVTRWVPAPDAERVGSVAHSIENLRTALTDVRDQLSADTWRAFGVVERAHEALAENPHSHQVADTAGRILTGVLSLQGVFASMMRDDGWHMIGAGRALERSLQLVHLLRSTTTVRRGIDVDRTVLNAVLESAESAVTHRRRYRGYVRPAGVLELLVVDPDNPRSLAFSLAEVRDLSLIHI